jgi:hypothetical protein
MCTAFERRERAKGNDNAAKDREEKTVVVPAELPLDKDRNKGRVALPVARGATNPTEPDTLPV